MVFIISENRSFSQYVFLQFLVRNRHNRTVWITHGAEEPVADHDIKFKHFHFILCLTDGFNYMNR